MESKYKRILDADVFVAGAGTAGISAAIQAAREGLKVILVERSDTLGGIMSVCRGMPLGCAYPCHKVIGGIFEEYVDRLMKFDPPAAWIRTLPESVFGQDVYYNQDIAMYILYDMLEKAGVNLILQAVTGDVQMDGERVTGVEYHDMTGTNLVRAKIFIDCTGNGDIAYRAGVPYVTGDENGEYMTYTLTFVMANIDVEKAAWDVYGENGNVDMPELVERGVIPAELVNITYSKMVEPGRVYFNYIRERSVNGLDPDDLFVRSQQARRKIIEVYKYFRKNVAGFANAYLDGIGSLLGVRDTRRLEGMHCLTVSEIMAAEKFPESGIVCCDNAFDSVGRGDKGPMTKDSIGDIGDKGKKYYRIPFGVLVPKKVKNLMFAGRILSAEAKAMASARGMGSCFGMGQATGLASSLVIRSNLDVQDIPTTQVVDGMIRCGMAGLGNNSLI